MVLVSSPINSNCIYSNSAVFLWFSHCLLWSGLHSAALMTGAVGKGRKVNHLRSFGNQDRRQYGGGAGGIGWRHIDHKDIGLGNKIEGGVFDNTTSSSTVPLPPGSASSGADF